MDKNVAKKLCNPLFYLLLQLFEIKYRVTKILIKEVVLKRNNLSSTFCITSVLSLIGCSPAEPISVYTDVTKIKHIFLT